MAPHKRVMIPSAQLFLPMGTAVTAQARAAFLRNSTAGDVTERIRRMAAAASAASSVQISPEIVGLILRAERELYYSGRNMKRAKRVRAV
jgi:hypothetical protein